MRRLRSAMSRPMSLHMHRLPVLTAENFSLFSFYFSRHFIPSEVFNTFAYLLADTSSSWQWQSVLVREWLHLTPDNNRRLKFEYNLARVLGCAFPKFTLHIKVSTNHLTRKMIFSSPCSTNGKFMLVLRLDSACEWPAFSNRGAINVISDPAISTSSILC